MLPSTVPHHEIPPTALVVLPVAALRMLHNCVAPPLSRPQVAMVLREVLETPDVTGILRGFFSDDMILNVRRVSKRCRDACRPRDGHLRQAFERGSAVGNANVMSWVLSFEGIGVNEVRTWKKRGQG